ncbi:MAG TPA: polysaccharide biosynthesis tyrosine autokinase, partial [Rubricoccaceae bacterium]
EIARAEADVERLSARLAADAAATGGGGPGDPQSAFQRTAALRTQLSDARTALQGAIATREAIASRLASYDVELAAVPSQSIDLARLQRDRLAAERLFQTLDQKLQEAQVAEEGELGYARVIRPAFASPVPFAPQRLRNVVLAALAGLLLGVTVAVARVRLDHRFARPDDVQNAGHTLLGTIPDFSDLIKKDFGGKEFVDVGGRRLDTRLISLLNPMATASETYRALRTSVQFSRPDAVVQTILVTSANPGEGKSVTAANLALVLAQAGRRVLLVDCDLRRPTVHKKFGINREPGLSHVVFGDIALDPALLAQPADDLWVLPSGTLVPNPSELLGSKRMRDLLEEMRGLFDVLVLDAPPVHAATDAVLLSTQADATVVVARASVTKDFDLESAIGALNGVGAQVIGVVLNGFDISKSYGYRYKYAYRYGSDYAYGHENQTQDV